MTDMTTEQALADALDNLVHDNYERSYRGSQERKADADLIRAALSRPAVPETLAKWASNPEEDDGIGWKQGYEAARRWVAMQLSRRSDLTSVVNASSAPEPAEQHPDDAAVDRFAQAMKAKLAQARAKGRSGWDDPAQCSPEYLADLLAGHVRKGNDGNFVDVANFAMMLHQRGAAPSVMPDAIRRSAAEESLTTEQALQAENERLRSIISDIKDWDCDVSGGFLSIPVGLRRRMQEAIDAHPQSASDVARLGKAPINVSYCDGNGAVRSRPEDCRYGVSYVTVADTVYWPLSAEDAQLLRSAECGRGDFTGPGTSHIKPPTEGRSG